MTTVQRAFLLVPILALVAGLSACGSGENGQTTAGPAAQTSPQAGASSTQTSGRSGVQPRRPNDKPGATDHAGSGGGPAAGAGKQKAASLATRPASIRGAIVTATGAVQTLKPNKAARSEAMENSYPSIESFGAESSGQEATEITFALVQYLNAKVQGDWATACARLYAPLREKLTKLATESEDPQVSEGGCPAALGVLMERAPESESTAEAKIDVASVRRGEDDRAFVIYKTPAVVSADMPLYLSDGVWTVGALTAYALTPEQLAAGQ